MPKPSSIVVAFFLMITVGVVALIAVAFGPEIAGKIRYDLRRHDKLPVVLIEHDGVAYCRTRICDFSFPLPAGSGIVRVDPVKEDGRIKGAVEFIDGTIYITAARNQPDLSAYQEQAQNYLALSRDWLSREIITQSTITTETSGKITAVHFHVLADSTPLGYY